ncbi:MAG: Glu-tRNA(Gln) amidotransferase subunit GatE [Candidatus Diapherotrites archaeon]
MVSMEPDYAKIGLKAGLEVHQQLNTGKLFCRCPSKLREDPAAIKFGRRLNAVASETGEYDRAALDAAKLAALYSYEAYSDTNCLVEADEEPPAPPDAEALDTVLGVSLLADARIFDSIFAMRKLILDGSATASFQRTMLVACCGKIALESGKLLGIDTIALEEDAAKIVERGSGGAGTYRLDRLGIPLIEIATAPELHAPEEVKDAALAIGNLLRSTGRAKRGLGTIRQDVNISIAQGARIEIKGVQELGLIDEYVRREVRRQMGLVELREELNKRGVREGSLSAKPLDISNAFASTDCGFIRTALGKGSVVLGVKLAGFSGLLGRELMPNYRFGTELASRVKAKAGLKGIMHSDELPAQGISGGEKGKAAELLGCAKQDGFVFACAPRREAKLAIAAVLERCAEALHGVPKETRNALPDGNTEYLRPLAGAARMYPETDLAPVVVDAKKIAALRKSLPMSAAERKKYYVASLHLGEKLAEKMKLSNYAILFEELARRGHSPTAAAVLLLEVMPRLRREGTDTEAISEEMVAAVLGEMKKGRLNASASVPLLKAWANEPEKTIHELLAARGYAGEATGEKELRSAVARVVERNIALVNEKGMHAMGALMGELMKELRGRVSGGEASRILKEEIGKRL